VKPAQVSNLRALAQLIWSVSTLDRMRTGSVDENGGDAMALDRTLNPLLTLDLDFANYSRQFTQGKTPDLFPYGLEKLPQGWQLNYPSSYKRTPWLELSRRAFRRISGFDIIGAIQRWRYIQNADVIYAHSEVDYLAAALLLRIARRRRPILVGHTIWLFAEWDTLAAWKRLLIHFAMARVDLFIYNAMPNRDSGRKIFPDGIHEYIPFGISTVFKDARPWRGRPRERLPLILAVGNDRSRDWNALVDALAGLPIAVDIRFATHREPPVQLHHGVVRPTADIAELCELYRTAACLIVASKPNAHAGGITTLLEGASIGVPAVATDTGGLSSYFDKSQVAFVPPGKPAALQAEILRLVNNSADAKAMGERARDRVSQAGYTNDLYWTRVVTCLQEKGLLEASRCSIR
jgi:glycosyltransferase involved in cell wall biosynthesis